MEVCIIGAGFSGISAAKVSMGYNLTPFILEKAGSPGGVWNGFDGEIGIYNSLEGNNSKHIIAFSDFLWPSEIPEFPTGGQTLNYLHGYIEKHELSQYIHYNCQVTEVIQSNGDYLVTWKSKEQLYSKVFAYVIIASGKFSKEDLPFKNLDAFNGTIVKGGYYREPSVFYGKRVVFIGKAYTASDIALEALSTAASVTQVYKKQYICMPKYVGMVPCTFYTTDIYSDLEQATAVPTLKGSGNAGKMMLKLFGNPGEYLSEWDINEKMLASEFFKSSIHKAEYFSAIKEKRISCIRGEAEDLYENGVILKDGTQVEADVIVTGMGYATDYRFLSREIKNTLQYDEKDKLLPVIMYRSMFHPDLAKLGFIGLCQPGIPGRYELQAEVIFSFFTGNLRLSKEQIEQGVRDELHIRNDLRELAWPYNLAGYALECMKILGRELNLDTLRNELGYYNGPILPYFLFMDRPGQIEICRQAVEEIKVKYPGFIRNH